MLNLVLTAVSYAFPRGATLVGQGGIDHSQTQARGEAIVTRQAQIAEDGALVRRRSWLKERQLALAALVAIAAIAIALRLVPIVFVPSVAWPDEIFQILESAQPLA